MRQAVIVVSIFLCAILDVSGQKEDYVWLSGYRGANGFAGYDSLNAWVFGHSAMDFNYTPSQITYDSLRMNFSRTNVSYCDGNGHLLFYSNGIYIANALDGKIENSDSLNYGYWLATDLDIMRSGYRAAHGMIVLRNPANNNQFYLLCTFVDTMPSSNILYPKIVLGTLLDMSENAGLGKVLFKNYPLFGDNISLDILATRHGNGKDWWVVAQKRNTNCYYVALLDGTGVSLVDSSCENIIIDYNNISSSVFASDGSKYAIVSYNDGLLLFDFNRCNGRLSNSQFFPMPFLKDSGWAGVGVAFSPNNRFLYVSATKIALQYDLWATDIAGSVDTVALYDGYKSPFGSYFNTAQMGPDGKIYLSCGNGEDVYHVIERPNEKGDSCLFIQHGVQLPTFSLGVPNFPNYRLGTLPGSSCDSLTGLNEQARAEKERIIKVFPNPTTDYVVVDYGFTDWNKGDVDLEITNASGQIQYQQEIPRYSGFQKVTVKEFPSGAYTVYIKRNGQVVAANRFVKH